MYIYIYTYKNIYIDTCLGYSTLLLLAIRYLYIYVQIVILIHTHIDKLSCPGMSISDSLFPSFFCSSFVPHIVVVKRTYA